VARIALRLAAFVAGAVLAFCLAAGSVVVHRPVLMAVGNMCDPSADNPGGLCYQRLPAGGWPFAFLYDDPGTSVLGTLGPEDDFRPGWFLVDAAIFAVLPAIGVVVFLVRRRRSAG